MDAAAFGRRPVCRASGTGLGGDTDGWLGFDLDRDRGFCADRNRDGIAPGKPHWRAGVISFDVGDGYVSCSSLMPLMPSRKIRTIMPASSPASMEPDGLYQTCIQ